MAAGLLGQAWTPQRTALAVGPLSCSDIFQTQQRAGYLARQVFSALSAYHMHGDLNAMQTDCICERKVILICQRVLQWHLKTCFDRQHLQYHPMIA